MTHIIYPTQQSRSQGICHNPTAAKCLSLYRRHLTNVLTLEKLKGLHPNDFKWSQQCEHEILIGQKKMSFWYTRGSFSAKDLTDVTYSVRLEVNKLKIG